MDIKLETLKTSFLNRLKKNFEEQEYDTIDEVLNLLLKNEDNINIIKNYINEDDASSKGMEQIFSYLEKENISISIYEEDGIKCGYELNTFTKGGVNMILFLDFRDKIEEFDTPKGFIEELKEWVKGFNVDNMIDLYRQDENYKLNFSIQESLEDFLGFELDMKLLITKLENVFIHKIKTLL